MRTRVLVMEKGHIPGVVALQRECFPEPFPAELLWTAAHLEHHIEIFPAGQLVVLDGQQVVASASATCISENIWQAHHNWDKTVGGPLLQTYDPDGTTIYGLDISVHPGYRSRGFGRALYNARFQMVKERGMTRYGTACRLPDYRAYQDSHPLASPGDYAQSVAEGRERDRTLTPLLSYGLTYLGVIADYMEDYESSNTAALLEWKP